MNKHRPHFQPKAIAWNIPNNLWAYNLSDEENKGRYKIF